MVINKDDGSGEATAFCEKVEIPVLAAIPQHDDIRRKSANYEIVAVPDGRWGGIFETLGDGVAHAPPLHPKPLEHEGLLDLFAGDEVGRDVVLTPATEEDMRGPGFVDSPSLEIVYDDV
jgi:chlorophyllide a reductase subunit X